MKKTILFIVLSVLIMACKTNLNNTFYNTEIAIIEQENDTVKSISDLDEQENGWKKLGESAVCPTCPPLNKKFYYKKDLDNKIWMKIVSDRVLYIDSTGNAKFIDGYDLTLSIIDCDKKQHGLLKNYVYSKHGKRITSWEIQEHLVKMENILPDTSTKMLLDSICNTKHINSPPIK